ncbi:MAG: orotidine-5'-phosphate decarboxylase [Vicinamibacterales bacterium]
MNAGATNPILIALDFSSGAAALAMANALRGAVGGFKIGSQLFVAEGPAIVRALTERGDRVFLDLKFHDIPNTVAGAVESAAHLGAWMMNVHASGGAAMMSAAVDAADRAAASGRPRPLVIAVTVLTSMSAQVLSSVGVTQSPFDQVLRLATLAKDSGMDGVVASPLETAAIREACGRDFLIVTPGIRGGSAEQSGGRQDQARTMAPGEAMLAGASYLVIGRPITGAADPRLAAQTIAEEISGTGPPTSP